MSFPSPCKSVDNGSSLLVAFRFKEKNTDSRFDLFGVVRGKILGSSFFVKIHANPWIKFFFLR